MGNFFSSNKPLPSAKKPQPSSAPSLGTIKSIIRQPGELDLSHLNKCNKLFKRNSHAITKFCIQLIDQPPRQSLPLPLRSRKAAQMLQQKRTMSSLQYTFTASSDYEMSFLISKLKGLHHLTSLNLDLSSVKSCTPEHLKYLSTTLGNFKKLTSLNITFPNSLEMTPKHIICLGFGFHRLRSLVSLSLKLSPQQRPNFPSLKPLAKLLSKLTGLQYLILSQFASIVPLALTFIPPVLKKLTSLEGLGLDLADMGSFYSKHLNQIFLALKDRTIPLKSLAFNFKDCAVDFPNSCPLSRGLAMLDLSQLQSFKLNCYSNLTSKALEQLTAVLNTAPLKLLSLDLSKCRFSSSSPHFSLNLQAFQSLSCLSINPCDLKNGLQGVGTAIKPLVNLKFLEIDFSKQTKENVDEKELIDFSANLRGLQNLKHFSLNLKDLSTIPDKGLIALSENLQCLTRLSKFNLELVEIRRGMNKDILSLLTSLTKLKKLTDLFLDLSKSHIFSVRNLHNLAEVLQSLSLLNSVNLDFSNCESLSEEKESFGPLFRSLGKLKSLKKIILRIPSSIEDQTRALDYIKHIEDQAIDWDCLNPYRRWT